MPVSLPIVAVETFEATIKDISIIGLKYGFVKGGILSILWSSSKTRWGKEELMGVTIQLV